MNRVDVTSVAQEWKKKYSPVNIPWDSWQRLVQLLHASDLGAT